MKNPNQLQPQVIKNANLPQKQGLGDPHPVQTLSEKTAFWTIWESCALLFWTKGDGVLFLRSQHEAIGVPEVRSVGVPD